MSNGLWNDHIEELDFPEVKEFETRKNQDIKKESKNKIKPH